MSETAAVEPSRPKLLNRAQAWAEEASEVVALVLYGSLATGRGHALSDADLVIVAASGRRDRLWDRRREIAESILGQPVVWSHELPWQRDHRYQAWAADLEHVDLTFDEGAAEASEVLRGGFRVLVGSDELARDLAADVATLPAAEIDPLSLQDDTWAWFVALVGWLRQGRSWQVYSALIELLNSRVVPLLCGGSGHEFEQRAEPERQVRLQEALPTRATAEALARALPTCMELYDEALASWAARHGVGAPPPGALGPAARDLIRLLRTAQASAADPL